MNFGSFKRSRNLFPAVQLLSLVILSLYTIESSAVAAGLTETQDQAAGIIIDLAPTSDARFFECGVTPSNGTSSLNGLNEDESAQSVVTDRDLNTNIMGKAIFHVSLVNSSVVNIPGPEVMVVEMVDPEPMNVSISDPETGQVSSKIYRPTPGNGTYINDCQYTVNQVMIDLSGLGIREGSAVSKVSLDNRGVQDTQIGSDIAEIFVLKSQPDEENLPINNTGTEPYFTQDWM